jgi:hypothetical protein
MRTAQFRITPMLAAIVLAAGLTSAAQAGGSAYPDPYDQPSGSLHFADLETSVGSDPRLWSADPRWEAHRTPADLLAKANAALHSAVPAGTTADHAAAVLAKAGAHCGAPGAAELDCRYNTVQTPFGGADFDNVTWNVKLALADGRVGDIAVTRDWTRR